VPEANVPAFLAAGAAAGVPAAVIGTVVEGEGPPAFWDEGGERRFKRGSFSHF